MRLHSLVAALALVPTVLTAQHAAAPSFREAPAEAREFDFLIGQWELVVRRQPTTLGERIHGVPEMAGTWKAWRTLEGWGVADELRITSQSGTVRGFTTSTRMYDMAARRWTVASADASQNAMTTAVGGWLDDGVTVTSSGTDAEGAAYLARVRFSAITQGGFTCEEERSTDNGRTWRKILTITARRVSAAAAR